MGKNPKAKLCPHLGVRNRVLFSSSLWFLFSKARVELDTW